MQRELLLPFAKNVVTYERDDDVSRDFDAQGLDQRLEARDTVSDFFLDPLKFLFTLATISI